ncbi:hypothetical protein A3J61_01235 [Candidatus Nomurabacteria bacterium RIFCSPHIGHO2_02_FULL_38_15]|uniref:Uncharacterized protein n=1 Tax=Candidatus Nomurabacteria bacterium RIFCSPHIGHO2_02_FULL_38_15 TaxID=1801752 RepID=A0A1F6VSJ4_9BACT|nr:MAG: hypothetical protein A3J61_01235 [Candidatus Nomurabacteria bacterium RIFCSPHIGHO2_02_FULL_38_15]
MENNTELITLTLTTGALCLVLSFSRLTANFNLLFKLIIMLGALGFGIWYPVVINYNIVTMYRLEKELVFFFFLALCTVIGHYIQIVARQRRLRRESI